MHKADKIFLLGFMGSGKSTAGRKLAIRLHWSFIDLDKKIEQIAGMKISDIFTYKGESVFREIETKTLQGLSDISNAVISTGGGTPCFGNNMDFMLENGLTIYLRMTPDALEQRLLKSKGERPLLKGISSDDLKDYIVRKLEEREKWYMKALMVIERDEMDISALHSIVRKFIK
jgi:shikimate kinase